MNGEGVAVDGKGNFYFISLSNVVELLAVNGVLPASPTAKTLGSGFFSPESVAVDASGNVFVADEEPHGTTAIKEIVAVDGVIPHNAAVRTLVSAPFSPFPFSVAVDANGNVFFLGEAGEDLVIEEILAVNGSIPASPTIQTVQSAQLVSPSEVAVDANGNLFVIDNIVDIAGQQVVKEVLALNGSIPANPTVNIVSEPFDFSVGVAADNKDDVFFTDYTNQQLVKLQLGPVNFGSIYFCPAGVVGPTPCNRKLTLTFNVAAGVTIGAVNVLSTEASTPDFQVEANDKSITLCSPQTYSTASTCTVDVTFAPTAAGRRDGTVQIVDSAGNTLATNLVYGTGLVIVPGQHKYQTITFPAIGRQVVGHSVDLAATASSGLPVTFASTNTLVCTVSGSAAVLLNSGYCGIEASQAGNAEYFGTITAQFFPVHPLSQKIDFPPVAPQTAAHLLTLHATASSGQPVTFSSNTPTICRADFYSALDT